MTGAVEDLEPYRAAWSLFVGLERQDGRSEIIRETYDADTLLLGMGVVASRLRLALIQHADHFGCDCGSDQWLERELLHNAEDS
jgi:hypothetical protein